MAGIKDVAAAAGVSVATVSRALNGHPSVSPTARTRVLDAVRELGYRPNAVARSLRTDQTRTLGLVISDVMNPYFTELARFVEEEARTLGYSVIIGNADERPELQDHHVRTLLDRRIDGLLVSPADGRSPLAPDAASGATPVVLVDRWVPGLDVPVVRADGTGAIRDLVAHLHGLGYRRVAVIAGPAATTTGRERVEAFRAALRDHGLPLPDEYLGQGDFQADSGRRATERFLDLPEPPEVVFATDNLMALGALDAVRARGLRVPDDIGVAAFDDIPWFVHTDPPVTAIAQPVAELARAAVRALVDLIEGRPPQSVTLPARLVVRRSCGEPACGPVPAVERAPVAVATAEAPPTSQQRRNE
ncbi:LacI family DNA-binding transcriptional regulator [Streptomyces otsuchiensis]|uniref:LacI family DNA-binding transcriptional regulator n=1 Tax=Streptomyces otsuchiensis TaxID=2681388 RepID=UPI0010322239|nr:LacI family DNA-binding transcriptional regulator [Streptomyces otsuchiensis]